MSKLDFKSILIGVFATTTLMVSINATTITTSAPAENHFLVKIGFDDWIVVPGVGLFDEHGRQQ